MAILTKPTIAKGQPNEIDLSKSELALLSKVVNDSYFSDQANWSKVIVEYKSAEGNQHEMMIFDATGDSPKGNFEVSEKARDSWEVQSVKIMDFDGGYLKLGRGDLTVENFDIALGSVGGDVAMLFSNSLHHSTNVVISSDQLTANFVSSGHALSENTEVLAGQKFYAEVTVSNPYYLSFGFSFFDDVPDVTNFNYRILPNSKLSVLIHGKTLYYGDARNSHNISNSSWSWFAEGDTIGIAIDTTNEKFYVKRNGVWLNDPETGTGGLSYAGYGTATNGDTVYLDFFGSSNSSITLVSDPSDIPVGYKLLGS